MKTMETIKNKQSELFKGISVDKIEKVMSVYRGWCNSRIQSMEDEFVELMWKLIENETDLDGDDIDKNYMELHNLYTDYNWESRFGLDDQIDIVKMINEINKI